MTRTTARLDALEEAAAVAHVRRRRRILDSPTTPPDALRGELAQAIAAQDVAVSLALEYVAAHRSNDPAALDAIRRRVRAHIAPGANR